MLTGSRLLITGVVTTDSLAFAVARRAQLLGAEVVLTALPRVRALARRGGGGAAQPAAASWTPTSPCRLTSTRSRTGFAPSWASLDGALHAVAYAPKAGLGSFLDAPAADVEVAFRTSVHSYAALARIAARPRTGRLAPAWSACTSTPRAPGRSTSGWASARPRWCHQPVRRSRPGRQRLPRQPGRGRPAAHPGRQRHRRLRRTAAVVAASRRRCPGIRTTPSRSPTRPASCSLAPPAPSPARCCTSMPGTTPSAAPLRAS